MATVCTGSSKSGGTVAKEGLAQNLADQVETAGIAARGEYKRESRGRSGMSDGAKGAMLGSRGRCLCS